jgi:hypothetical protein
MAVGECMTRLRKLSLTMLVWATATSTLLAGVPHSVCRCPDGTVSQCCAGTPSKESPCCKSTTTSPRPGKKSCCNHKIITNTVQAAAPANAKTAKGPTVDRTGCQRILASVIDQGLVRPETEMVKNPPTHVALAPQSALGQAQPGAVGDERAWRTYHLLPPTDLPTFLKRLTI